MTPAEFNYPIPRELLKAYADHGGEVETSAQLAALSGLRVAEVDAILNDPEKFAALEAHRAAHEMKGKNLKRRVHKLTEAMVGVFEKQVAAGLDVDLALEISKPLIRLMEIAERTRLAERDTDAGSKRVVVHINFGRAAVVIAPTLEDVSGVIDVQAVQIPTSAGGAL